jgi:hypothetical protein
MQDRPFAAEIIDLYEHFLTMRSRDPTTAASGDRPGHRPMIVSEQFRDGNPNADGGRRASS